MSDNAKVEEKHEQRYLSVDSLVPNAWNPQEQDDATFNRLVDEVNEVGFIDPIEVVPLDDGTFRIVGGEHRWRAAVASGKDEVPCIILSGAKWKDEDLQKFVTVRLNVIRGKLDPEKFLKLYQEMVDKYGADALQNMLGFTDVKAFQRVLGDVKKGMKKSLPKEMQDEFDKAAKEARTVEDLNKIIQALFTKYGDTVAQSFMIFTHGKREHLYVAMDRKMKKAMDKVIEHCKKSGEDINEFMEPLTQVFMQAATRKLKSSEKVDKVSNGVASDAPSFDGEDAPS